MEEKEQNEEQELILTLLQGIMHYLEQASVIQTLCKEYLYTQSTLAKRLGTSQAYVGNKVRLLQFSQDEQQMLKKYGLSERHARLLLRLQQPKRQHVIETVAKLHMTVQQTEDYVDRCLLGNTNSDSAADLSNISSPSTFLYECQRGAQRLQERGNRIVCITEEGDGWRKISVTIID